MNQTLDPNHPKTPEGEARTKVIMDLHSRFRSHKPPTEADAEKLGIVRSELEGIAISMTNWCPQGRELSLALTKLEEAMFWANAAIARSWP